MFVFAIFVGIYSYLIFFLGIFNLLTRINIFIITFLWLVTLFYFNKKLISKFFLKLTNLHFSSSKKNSFLYLFLVLIILQALVNLIGALGPELAFDALWYHLVFPKLYLQKHMIFHLPGGLLYYSDMPKLGEMLYTGALSFGNEIFAKFIHYFFGILVALALYKFSKKYFNQIVSLLIVVIFYSNLVIDWESITAYIDLIRTFLEFLSLWGLINWYESQKSTWLVLSGIMMGLAITTKLLAIGSFFILLFLFIKVAFLSKKTIKEILLDSFIFTICTFIIPLPWFIFSYVNTGNPVFPFFTTTYEVSASSPSFFKIFINLWDLFIHSADPISPLYLIFLPLLFVFFTKFNKQLKIIVWYSGLSLLLWYFTPRTGGGRFITPYLPAFSIICGAIYSEILKNSRIEYKYISRILLFVTVLASLISVGYRGTANKRYLPVIFGKESKQEFLSKNLNFHYGDFYDSDEFFAQHIKSTNRVLLYGFHNLYYVNFPFIDSSWVKRGDAFNYIATQNSKVPPKYASWQLIYSNDKTMVELFRPPKGECKKICQF